MRSVILIALLISFATVSRAAVVVGSHQGANDPVSEGWSRIRSFTGVSTSSVFNDVGSGIDAWKINDTSNADGIYGIQMTNEQLQLAAANDWRLSSNLRVVDGAPSSAPGDDASIHVAVHFQERRYSMIFGEEPTGLPWIGLPSDASLVFVPLSSISPNYNSYELRFSHSSGTADLYVNGGLAYSGYSGVLDPDSNQGPNDRTSEFLFFGSTYSNGTGDANYNSVSLTIAPQPSSILIYAIVAMIGKFAFFRRGKLSIGSSMPILLRTNN